MESSDEGSFDVIIIGTGLTESIAAAALSKAGYKVAHIDANAYYGDSEAAISQDEFVKWGEDVQSGKHEMFHSYSGSTQVLPHHRQYSLCLRATVIPSLGPLIAALIASGVSKYSGFRLLDSVSIYGSDGTVKNVPGSKEEVFKSKDISLVEKRRLMRFLTFAAGDFEDRNELAGKQDDSFAHFLTSVFSLSEEITNVIIFSLTHCNSDSDATLPSLKRLRNYLRSIGRYGPSPFLIGHYGGIGDIAQGFCRAAAVNGAVYILGRPILSIASSELPGPGGESTNADHPHFTVTLDNFPEPLTCKLLISGKEQIPSQLGVEVTHAAATEAEDSSPITSVARCIAIIDKPLAFRPSRTDESAAPGEEDEAEKVDRQTAVADTAVLVFPPSSLLQGSTTASVTVLITGEGSLSTPKGKWILYFMLPVLSPSSSEELPEELLCPYLDAVLALTIEPSEPPVIPLFTSFYYERVETAPTSPDLPPSTAAPARYLVTPPLNYTSFPDLPDLATTNAEVVFREAVKSLRGMEGEDEEVIEFWPPIEVEEEDDGEW